MITAERYHDISAGHRVLGHENKCKHLHGHNYRFHFTVTAKTVDSVGRILDFGVIKSTLCEWLENEWDHKMLIFEQDPYKEEIKKFSPDSLVIVPFNPTAENMAKYMVNVIGPKQLKGTGTQLIKCTIEETRKCSASYEIENK